MPFDKDLRLLAVVTGPSGSGKTTITRGVVVSCSDLVGKVITTTTRLPREGERQGVHYDFLSPDVFDAGVCAGEFIEHQKHYGFRYGTRRIRLMETFGEHRVALVCLDPVGALALQKVYRDTPMLSIFIQPANLSELAERMVDRGDRPGELDRRISAVTAEMALAKQFDHQVVNGNGQQKRATQEVISLITNYLAMLSNKQQ